MDSRTRTLTFGDDRSAGADAAWGWIAAHPWTGWAAEVVTVTIPKARSVASPLGYTEPYRWSPPEPRIAPASCEFASVSHLAADSDPRLILGGRAGSDLVVVGPRGQGLLKELHLGSTAEWLMRCPKAPLVIARRPARTRSVLMCVDGSTHAQAAVVVEPDRLDLTVNPHLTIFEHMAARGPDLVVLGTSGRSALKRLWVGSVASTVARHGECSVMLVRDPRGEDDDGEG